MSVYHKTSSIHGLMWAWFTINNEWQDVWNANSLHETYVGGDKSSRDGTGGAEQLPSSENFKHIILISDGYDNDGCEDRSGGTGSAEVGVGQGRLNVCDAYQPVEAVTDTEYTDLCTAIKTNGTSTANDDITIHTITFDFDVNFGAVSDGVCDKAGGVDNRFAQCATPGNFYNNKNPDELRDVFDDIFSGILTDGAAVRLIK